ncbi:MAG: serine/threonine-protein kinase [Bryobacteraceae bacterium]
MADNSETAVMPITSTVARVRASSTDGRLSSGTLIAARYQIVGWLGKGGMGEVYRADDLTLDQQVALKFLPAAMSRDPGMLARFYAEVRIARQISHPNVCRVYDIGEADGRPYLSMEYIDGEDLGSLLRRIGRLSADKAMEFARRICAGLAAAHDKGVLHRDLKPSNVMIDGQGRVFITDFGLAAAVSELREGQAREGTPAYMAPEQLAGKEVSVRSDIYALGLVLYEMFAGKRPFDAPTMAEMIRLQLSRPASLSSVARDVDPQVESVIQRCLAADPADRPGSALAVAAALPGGDPLTAALAAGETPSPELVASSGQSVGIRPAMALICLAATIAGLAGVMLLGGRSQMIGHLAMDDSPEVLLQKSRDLALALGYRSKPAGTAHGFLYDVDYVQYVRRTDKSPTRWQRMKPDAQPPPVVFWYRQSPRSLQPEPFALGTVTPSDPPPIVSGMLMVVLDPQGRLVEFDATPPQVYASTGASVAPDWRPLFTAAGLDPSRFAPASPEWTPLGICDARSAWTGQWGSGEGKTVRIEAAAWRGKPIYFQIIGPWSRPERMQSFQFAPELKALLIIALVVCLGLVTVSAMLARRNARLGRGDRRGAFRLAGFTASVFMLIWAFGGSHVAETGEILLFAGALSYALLLGAGVWMFYMAVEPFARRRWPQIMITWNRLLAGRIRDPLLGRDVLVGVALGVAVVLFRQVHILGTLGSGGMPSIEASLPVLLDTRKSIAGLLSAIPNSLIQVLAWFVLMFILRMILRRDWAAAGGVVLLYAVLSALASGGNPFLAAAFGAVETGVLIFVMLRFGLVAAIASSLSYVILIMFPITSDFSSWYAGVSTAALLFVAALAAFGFHSALAGRQLFQADI